MATLLLAFIKANWIKIGLYLVGGVDWAGIMAKVFNFVLTRAVRNKSYNSVRLLAKRVIEQANYVLAVTDDNVIDTNEAAALADTTRKLLSAWADGEGKTVTEPLEDIIKSVTEEK